jgi:hypothetical protein
MVILEIALTKRALKDAQKISVLKHNNRHFIIIHLKNKKPVFFEKIGF